jgi:hypothetical protein
MMTFLEAVNRVLRQEAILMGDDDDLTSFSDTQHAATSTLAQIAIQSQIADLVSDGYLPYEEKTGVVTATTARTYDLASDFQTFIELFFDELDDADEAIGTRITKYPGGEKQLRAEFPYYRENTGTPTHFYSTGGTTKSIGLWPVPDSTYSGTELRYYYEADVNVSVETDTVPLTTTTEAQVFVRMCARHFKYLRLTPEVREGLFPQGISNDPVILQARSTLLGLINPEPPSRHYGKRYSRTG